MPLALTIGRIVFRFASAVPSLFSFSGAQWRKVLTYARRLDYRHHVVKTGFAIEPVMTFMLSCREAMVSPMGRCYPNSLQS